MNNYLGQVNDAQARATILRMAAVGAVAALGVLSADLPKIVDTSAPLGMALAYGICQLIWYLKTGDPITKK